MTEEKIKADASVAAVYFAALLANGVPLVAAVTLTGNYAMAVRIAESQREEPPQPWDAA